MIYKFDDYEFDDTTYSLSKNGQEQAIRSNEAHVLALLLSEPARIFSKQCILSLVWPDKKVSEQAVFQNISSLRVLLGSHSIKTYARKGYQWKIPLSNESVSGPSSSYMGNSGLIKADETTEHHKNFLASVINQEQNANTVSSASAEAHVEPILLSEQRITESDKALEKKHQEECLHNIQDQSLVNKNVVITFLSFTILLTAITFYWVQQKQSLEVKNKAQINLVEFQLSPFHIKINKNPDVDKTLEDDFAHTITNALDEQDNLLVNKTNTKVDFDQASDPTKNRKTSNKLLLSGKVRLYEDLYYFNYHLQSPHYQWQSEIISSDLDEGGEELAMHIEAISNNPLMNSYSLDEHFISEQLQLLHTQNPHDLAIMQQYIKHKIAKGKLKQAKQLNQKLLAEAANKHWLHYLALGHLNLAELSYISRAKEDSYDHAKSAETLAQQSNSQDLLSQALLIQSYTNEENSNYEENLELLKRAITAAQQSQYSEILKSANLALYILAHEIDNPEQQRSFWLLVEKQFSTLTQRNLIQKVLPLFMAHGSKGLNALYFQRLLAAAKAQNESALSYALEEHLIAYYKEEQQWQSAITLLLDRYNTPQNRESKDTEHDKTVKNPVSAQDAYRLGKLYFINLDHNQALLWANKTNDAIDLDKEKQLGLNNTLLLLKIHQAKNNKKRVKQYSQWLKNTASKEWLAEHMPSDSKK